MRNRVIYLPMNSDIPFPDLVNSASCVVGKAGYGTVSECWGMNTPFGGIFRRSFRESDILRNFCKKNLITEEFSYSHFLSGEWLNFVSGFIDRAKNKGSIDRQNGASQACEEIIRYIFD